MDDIFDESTRCDDAEMAKRARKALQDDAILAFNLTTGDPHALSLSQLAKVCRDLDSLLKEVGREVEKTGPGERLMPVVHTMASVDNHYQLQIRIIKAPKVKQTT